MQSGETISLRLISDGSAGLNAPVDYIVDYKPEQSFFVGIADVATKQEEQGRATARPMDPLDSALEGQARVATPAWQQGTALEKKPSKHEQPALAGALGKISEASGLMLVAYSVRNQSDQWIEVLPPQIEVSSRGDKSDTRKKDKKHMVEAEQIPVKDFRVNGRRLGPGQRADGVVTFARPGFKQSQERLLLQLASANAVDKPLLLPVSFVAPR